MKKRRVKKTAKKIELVQSKQEPAKVKNKLSKFWKVVTGLSIVLGIIVSYPIIREMFMTQKEKFDKENVIEGDLKPPKVEDLELGERKYTLSEIPPEFKTAPLIDSTYPKIKGIYIPSFDTLQTSDFPVIFGTTIISCKATDFYKGINIFNVLFKDCLDTKFTLGIKENRLYVSTVFKDIQNEQVIGVIEYNHWKLYKSNLLTFQNDDSRLEVRDKQNNVVFSIMYGELDKDARYVIISGYFLNNSSVLIIPNSKNDHSKHLFENFCILKTDSAWKTKAYDRIDSIKSVFDYNQVSEFDNIKK
jgi:hypothetical protein